MKKDRRKAITLISLVITVIVLIILAGITIRLTIGEQGIFKHGEEAKVKQEIAQYIDKIEIARGEVTIEKLGRVAIDDIIKKIQDNNIIPGGKIEKLDNGKAEVITKEGYVIIVTVKETKYDRLETQERIPELQEGDIVISEPTWDTTTNKASVEINKGSNISEKLQIQYQVNDDKENGWTTGTSVGNLNHGDVVNARLWNGSTGGNYTSFEVVDSIVPNAPTISFVSGTEGTDGYYKSDVVLKITAGKDNQSGIQEVTYSFTGATTQNETVITSGDTITLSNDGTTTVIAYTYDKANNKSEQTTYTVKKDETVPGDANITISGATTQSALPVTLKANVTHSEATSGITIDSCKYVLSTASGNIGTNPSSYTGGTFSSNGQEITIKPSSATKWYLHVLTIDGAGNAKETIKGPITVTENKHTHTGSAGATANGCYTKATYHAHVNSCYQQVADYIVSYSSKSGKVTRYCNCAYAWSDDSGACSHYVYSNVTFASGFTAPYIAVCIHCGQHKYSTDGVYGGGYNYNGTYNKVICGKGTTTIEGYTLGCGKNEDTIESVTIIY